MKSIFRHILEKPSTCIECDETFPTSYGLSRHVLTHTGESPYQCIYCDKDFLYKSELSRHIVTHTGDNPYNHTDFDNALSEIANITKRLEIYDRNNSYKCSFCKKEFLQNCDIEKHMKDYCEKKNVRPMQQAKCKKKRALETPKVQFISYSNIRAISSRGGGLLSPSASS